jgi:hypothetical protein
MGIVKDPEATTFATEDPEIDPNRAELNTAIFAGPPLHFPVKEVARSIKKLPAPLFSRKAPKIINGKTKVAKVEVITPNIAS